jgi:hypothetical protein
MPTLTGRLSNDVLNAALAGLEAQRGKIEAQIEQVRTMLGMGTPRRGRPPKAAVAEGSPVVSEPPTRKRRKFSAETRARMKAAQQKRWAAIKESEEAPAKAATKKRKLSAAGRKRIIEATKKRWAEYNAKKAAS